MDSSTSSSSNGKSNKIRDIVRLQQILKKWKKVANSNKNSTSRATSTTTTTTKSIKFLKKTLSFSESSSTSMSTNNSNNNNSVPKGYMAVCVGKEEKRFVIPTEYLSHQLFGILLQEAEEEFGFQQEGVLKFPCEVHLFHKILKMMEDKSRSSSLSSSLSSPSLIMLHQYPPPHLNSINADHDDHHSPAHHDVDDDDDDFLITCSNSNDYSPDTTHDQLTHHHPQTCR